MKDFGKIMLIIGMVIGSGFASGKEIAVFFSRFGNLSYIFICFAVILFFGVFYWILSYGSRGIKRISSSKFFLSLFVLVSLVFTSSMFAGTKTTMSTGIVFVDVVLVLTLLLVCAFVSKNGISLLAKINTYLIPFTIIILIACLTKNFSSLKSVESGGAFSGFLFSALYVVMNVSTSSLVMGEIGKNMSKNSIFVVSFFSAIILGALLVFINLTLLSNPQSLNLSMPLLEMSGGVVYVLMRIVIFVGCLTTLLSLVYTTSNSLSKLGICGVFNVFISVFFPFFASFFGFGKIVSFLYPVVSVLGIFLITPFLPSFTKRKKGEYLKQQKK